MALDVQRTLDFGNLRKIVNLPDPVADGDASNKRYVDAAIEGLNWKDSARVGTSANINLASPGAALDGVTLASGDRVLIRGQTTASQNGIYIFNGAAVAMTRSLDANTLEELKNAIVAVDEGTDTGTTWRQSTVSGTIGTANIVFESFLSATPQATDTSFGKVRLATPAESNTGTGSGVLSAGQAANLPTAVKKFGALFGDGSATTYPINHNLNTFDVRVEIYRNSGNFDTVLAEVQRTSANSIAIVLDPNSPPPPNNAFKALIWA